MTLGTFLPLVTAVIAAIEIPLLLSWRSSGRISESAFPVLMLASLTVPVALYVVFNIIVPDIGAIELF